MEEVSPSDAGTYGNAGVGWRGSDAGLSRCGVQRCPERWRSEEAAEKVGKKGSCVGRRL